MIPVLVGLTTCADVTPPTVPTGVAASGISSTSFTLSWNASTDNVGVTNYRVYKDGSLYTTIASPTLNANISGLSQGTTYSMTVSAGDRAGNWSAQSSPLSVTTTIQSNGHIFLTPNNQTVNLGSSFNWTFSGDCGSFSNGTVTGFIADETTGGGYQQILTQSVSGSYNIPVSYTPGQTGNYSVQGRITTSGGTVFTFSITGGFVCQ